MRDCGEQKWKIANVRTTSSNVSSQVSQVLSNKTMCVVTAGSHRMALPVYSEPKLYIDLTLLSAMHITGYP